MKTTKMITCALLISSGFALAQDPNNKEVKVRIKKIENINGVEIVTDTTYTTTESNLRMSEDVNAPIRVIRKHRGENSDPELELISMEAESDTLTGANRKVIVIRDEKSTEAGSINKKIIMINSHMDEASEAECKKAGIKKTSDANLFEINCTPNPSRGTFKLTFAGADKDPVDITIKDINGRIVYSEKLKNFEGRYSKEITIDSISGVYFVTLVQGSKTQTKKLVVE